MKKGYIGIRLFFIGLMAKPSEYLRWSSFAQPLIRLRGLAERYILHSPRRGSLSEANGLVND